MPSENQRVQGNGAHYFSGTPTLSDFPLLIGEILRRSDLRLQKRAKRRVRIQKMKGLFPLL
jgi:hypothetical protein